MAILRKVDKQRKHKTKDLLNSVLSLIHRQFIFQTIHRSHTTSDDSFLTLEPQIGNFTSAVDTLVATIKNTSAYNWLIWRIENHKKLEFTSILGQKIDFYPTIREAAAFQQGDKLQFGLGAIRARFAMDLDIPHFHQVQQYDFGIPDTLGKAVVLTGSENNMQASTCREYVDQVWGSDGVELLNMLQQALSDFLNDKSYKDTGPRGNIKVLLCNKVFWVECTGMPLYMMTVAAELLAWLSLSLRHDEAGSETTGKDGTVPNETTETGDKAQSKTTVQFSSFRFSNLRRIKPGDLCFDIHVFTPKHPERIPINPQSPGNCWGDLLNRGIVVAARFPVPRRATQVAGLEASLEVMAALAGTTYLVNFRGRTFIKGFSTILVVTQVTDTVIVWHFLHNDDGTYISYADSRLPSIESSGVSLALDYSSLVKRRHILGWSPRAESNAGE